MGIVVTLREVKSGEEREYRVETPEYWEEPEATVTFQWEEGNYSCDCNRERFYRWAGGHPEDKYIEAECGEGRYLVRVTGAETGRVYYDELGTADILEKACGDYFMKGEWKSYEGKG